MPISSPAPDSDTHLSALNWRYATKAFDPTRKIPEETWKALEQTLVLTPSSFGLQPWKFLVIRDTGLRARLRPHANNQAQVVDCSHFVVFAMRKNLTVDYIENYVRRAAVVQRVSVESLQPSRDSMVGSLVEGHRSLTVNTWASNQAFIALGQLMLTAALMKIDACPMEGFDPRAFDQILDIGKRGLSAVVCCALGYRSESDKHALQPKVRFERKDVFEDI